MEDWSAILFAIVSIGICVATVVRTRCIERRMNAEYDLRAKDALRRFREATDPETGS